MHSHIIVPPSHGSRNTPRSGDIIGTGELELMLARAHDVHALRPGSFFAPEF